MADQTNFQAAAYTQQGTQRDAVALPGDTFDGTVNMPVMHQAVKAFLANQRQANAHTKIRKYVTGGNQKPWKQKGTGRARQGSTRAPHFVGGGTVFGPTNDRNYHQDVPKKVKALARKSALNARAREGALLVIDRFDFDAPKTARMMALVGRLELEGKKVLVLTDGVKPNVFLSARNLPTVHVMPFSDASTYHVLWSDVVLVEGAAIGQDLSPVAETEAAPKAKKAPKAAAEPKAKKASKSTASSGAKRATKAPAAKKAPAKKAAAKKAPAKKAAAKKAPAKKAAPKRKEK
jgi:large subunit ribosomal protein L4